MPTEPDTVTRLVSTFGGFIAFDSQAVTSVLGRVHLGLFLDHSRLLALCSRHGGHLCHRPDYALLLDRFASSELVLHLMHGMHSGSVANRKMFVYEDCYTLEASHGCGCLL